VAHEAWGRPRDRYVLMEDRAPNEAEAAKLQEIARSAQASAIEAVRMARRANWRAMVARNVSIAAMFVSIVALIVTVL
jgi:hypothetical protein